MDECRIRVDDWHQAAGVHEIDASAGDFLGATSL